MLRYISYTIDECFKSILIELQISKHSKINVGYIYIEHRILALANFNKIYHIY